MIVSFPNLDYTFITPNFTDATIVPGGTVTGTWRSQCLQCNYIPTSATKSAYYIKSTFPEDYQQCGTINIDYLGVFCEFEARQTDASVVRCTVQVWEFLDSGAFADSTCANSEIVPPPTTAGGYFPVGSVSLRFDLDATKSAELCNGDIVTVQTGEASTANNWVGTDEFTGNVDRLLESGQTGPPGSGADCEWIDQSTPNTWKTEVNNGASPGQGYIFQNGDFTFQLYD